MAGDSLRSWVSAIALALALAIAALLLELTFADPGLEVLMWGLALAAASLVVVPASSGRRWSLMVLVAAAVPLLAVDPDTARVNLLSVLAAYLGGTSLGLVIRLVRGGNPSRSARAAFRQITGISLYATIVTGSSLLVDAWGGTPRGAALAATGVAAVLWFGFEVLAWAATTTSYPDASMRYRVRLALADWPVAMSLVMSGGLYAIAWPVISWWAVIVAAVPYIFAHTAFRRSASSTITYNQTIRALARIPEVAGFSPVGQADATADLATAIALDMGLDPDQVEEVRYAGYLHDIGRITLNEPSVVKQGYSDDDIARWGSEIVGEAPYLERVSAVIRTQYQPYRTVGEQEDASLPRSAKIVRVAGTFSRMRLEDGTDVVLALEELHRGAAYDYDPEVVRSLRSILERRGEI